MTALPAFLLLLGAAAASAGAWVPGNTVTVTGRVSKVPGQHLVRAERAADAVYFDVEKGGQIVAYVRGGIGTEGRVRLTGTVVVAEGGSKRPGSTERYTELQLDVTSWEELGEPGAPKK